MQVNNLSTLLKLRWRFGGVTAVFAIFLFLFFLGLRSIWPDQAARWLGQAALALAIVLVILWRGLPENHREGETALLPTLGWGNNLTLLRGLAMSVVAGFLFLPWPSGGLAWAPMAFYTLADIADYLDGYLARKTNHATLLGVRLDIEYDGLGVLIVSVLGVWYGNFPWWYLLLGVSRWLFIAGQKLRERRGKPVYDMPPSVHRRIIAGFQMGFMSAALWPIIPAAGSKIAATVFGMATAVSFLRDWLIVSGQLNPAAPAYLRMRRQAYLWLVKWLPVVWRGTAVLGIIAILSALPQLFPPDEWTHLLASWRMPHPQLWAVLTSVVAIVATVAIGLGAMGRLAGLLLVFPIGFDMVVNGLLWRNGAALTAVCLVMLFGGGLWSLWQPEERLMTQRAGENGDW